MNWFLMYKKIHKWLSKFNHPIMLGWLQVLETIYFWVYALKNIDMDIDYDIDLTYFWHLLSDCN